MKLTKSKWRKWAAYAILALVLGWGLFLPVQPYRATCDRGVGGEEILPPYSDIYLDMYRSYLSGGGVPFFEFGGEIYQPLFAWGNENEFWYHAMVKPALMVATRFENAGIEHDAERTFDAHFYAPKGITVDDRQKLWCDFMTAAVKPHPELEARLLEVERKGPSSHIK